MTVPLILAKRYWAGISGYGKYVKICLASGPEWTTRWTTSVLPEVVPLAAALLGCGDACDKSFTIRLAANMVANSASFTELAYQIGGKFVTIFPLLLLYVADANNEMKPTPVSLAEVRRQSIKSRAFHSVRAGKIEFVKVNTDAWRWRDVYRWLLGLRWPQFGVFVGTLYIALNLLFAALYSLQQNSIAGTTGEHWFFDCFFFSVQTLATVGYGHVYPQTLYGHIITTIEIMSGIFLLAVMTGLI